MTTQIVENLELFSEALEFLPEELENIESELYPNLESISLEVVAKDLEAYFEGDVEGAVGLERRGGRRKREAGDPVRPAQITRRNYNRARDILRQAGSQTANAAHQLHGIGNVPVHYGLQLLREARGEGIGRQAITSAARAMGLHPQLGRAVW
ncbi:hypothetical protein [Nostoc sp. FACHB-133]|uniref:hypothetical protein n=1 Tax=Nostoc sp. FACHB-133 TaxID=2692835 RepID=UPI001686DD5D|nr:hypothetical protein [Nostoc sp. FACHB-133]MBD2526673.1 hypothetical protein [Nostoc sp. FACHB-133]